MKKPTAFSYSKPIHILKGEQPIGKDPLSELEYIQIRKAKLEKKLADLNVHIRKAKLSDMSRIIVLSERAYQDLEIKDLVTAYDYYQSITYHYGLVVCLNDDPEKLVGCFFNYAFHADGDKNCNLKRLAIDPDYQRLGIGRHLFEYNQLMAKEVYGSRIQTGLIEYFSFASICLVLNKMGGVIDFITDEIAEYFLGFSFVIALDMNNWRQMEISQDALADYIQTLEESKDYIIIKYTDKAKMIELCTNQDFKIAAVLQAGKLTKQNSLVAFSNEILQVKLQ